MYQQILVPIDGSTTSERALDEAIIFARQQNSCVEIVHVLEDIWYFDSENYLNYAELMHAMKCSGEKILAQAQSKLRQAGVVVKTKLLEAHGERIANVIMAEAKNNKVDLIVIGTHGRSGFSHMLLGSVAEGIVRTSHIPVLLIRGG